jgi:hypothetical protein
LEEVPLAAVVVGEMVVAVLGFAALVIAVVDLVAHSPVEVRNPRAMACHIRQEVVLPRLTNRDSDSKAQ